MVDPIPLIPGDAPTFRFEIKTLPPDGTTNGDPFDLTDYLVDFFIKRSMQDSDLAAEFHGELGDGVGLAFEVTDGIVDVRVPASVTSNLRVGRLYPWYLVLSHTIVTEKIFIPSRGVFLVNLPGGE